jgi:hypothetical protein
VPYFGDADLNNNVELDQGDFALFIQYWRKFHLESDLVAAADFNDDGKLDHQDASYMVSEWVFYGPRAGTSSVKASSAPKPPAKSPSHSQDAPVSAVRPAP